MADSITIFYLIRVISDSTVPAGDYVFSDIRGYDPAVADTTSITATVGSAGVITGVTGLGLSSPIFVSDYEWRFAGFTTPDALADGGAVIEQAGGEVVTSFYLTDPTPAPGVFTIVNLPINNPKVALSPQGVALVAPAWQIADVNFLGFLQSIVWSPELGIFVAVGGNYGNTIHAGAAGVLVTSTDGVNWIKQAVPVAPDDALFQSYLTSIAWSPELSLFVATGTYQSTDFEGLIKGYSLHSSDGVTWLAYSIPPVVFLVNELVSDIKWVPELSIFVVVDYNHVLRSGDAITWTRSASISAFGVGGVATWITWSPELSLFVVTGLSNSNVLAYATSPDADIWTTGIVPSPAAFWSLHPVEWSPQLGVFVWVIFANTTRVFTSTDGVAWAERFSFATGGSYGGSPVVWNPDLGLFSFIASVQTNVSPVTFTEFSFTSPDGVTWTPLAISTELLAPNHWLGMTWSPEVGRFVAVRNAAPAYNIVWGQNPGNVTYEVQLLLAPLCANPVSFLVMNYHDLSGCPGGIGIVTATVNGGPPVVVGQVPAGTPYVPGETTVVLDSCAGDVICLNVDCLPLPCFTVPDDPVNNPGPFVRVRPPTSSDFNTTPTPLPPPVPAPQISECVVLYLFDYQIADTDVLLLTETGLVLTTEEGLALLA
jgi:hypothetical protein